MFPSGEGGILRQRWIRRPAFGGTSWRRIPDGGFHPYNGLVPI